MTWLLIRALWLVASWTLHPNYYVETKVVMEERLYDERERNYQNEQEQIIIEDYFLFLEQIGKINYARWCAWSYTPPVRNAEQWKRVRCWEKSFDCAGLIKCYGVAKWLLESKDLKLYNSQTLMDLATRKDWMVARRWDWTSWKWVDWTHFAIVSREYEGDWILWVYDNVNWQNLNQLRERPLRVRYSQWRFIYLGKRVIEVYTNWYVDLARENRIHVESWQLIEQLPETIIEPEKKLYKKARADDDPRQKMIQDAYEIWGMDHVILIECENGGWNIEWKWDWWDSIWLCQINRRWHKPPIEFYTDYKVQLEYCLEKRMWWTLFYWPERINKDWVMCMEYAKERFERK